MFTPEKEFSTFIASSSSVYVVLRIFDIWMFDNIILVFIWTEPMIYDFTRESNLMNGGLASMKKSIESNINTNTVGKNLSVKYGILSRSTHSLTLFIYN